MGDLAYQDCSSPLDHWAATEQCQVLFAIGSELDPFRYLTHDDCPEILLGYFRCFLFKEGPSLGQCGGCRPH